MLAWSVADNLWLRRIAIIHQLLRRPDHAARRAHHRRSRHRHLGVLAGQLGDRGQSPAGCAAGGFGHGTILSQGTGTFSKDNSLNKTFRTDNYISYGLFAMYGTINSLNAAKSNASEEDLP